jgi:hypothetical protein
MPFSSLIFFLYIGELSTLYLEFYTFTLHIVKYVPEQYNRLCSVHSTYMYIYELNTFCAEMCLTKIR